MIKSTRNNKGAKGEHLYDITFCAMGEWEVKTFDAIYLHAKKKDSKVTHERVFTELLSFYKKNKGKSQGV